MSARAIGQQAANAAAANWRSPDATIKGKGGLAEKKAQMEALRTQILSDYKKNTEDAEKVRLALVSSEHLVLPACTYVSGRSFGACTSEWIIT
jgi:hypothetical protein